MGIYQNIHPYSWSTLRVPVSQTDSTWGLVDRAGAPLAGISPVYEEAMGELTYQHEQTEQEIQYWSLPDKFLGAL